ncbi:MAG: DUF92 domain-containing protein [Calditrichaeota bacterium]|nr:DUF92 domain-containing protein [Calditrichota bacterium]
MNWTDFFPATAAEWLKTIYFFIILSFLIGISEFLSRSFGLSKEFTRKFVHVSVGVLVFIFSFFITGAQALIFLCLVFSIINLLIIKFDLVPALNGNRKSYGTVYYPLALMIALIMLWDHYKIIFLNIVLILALADAAAAIVGQNSKKPITYKILNDVKTIQGSSAMFFTTFIIIVGLYFTNEKIELSYSIWIIAPIIALIITLAEAISSKGSDNLSISIISGFFLFIFFFGSEQTQMQTIYSLFFAAIIAITSTKLGFLKTDGALAVSMLSIIIYGLGGWKWTFPILTFFILSSILSYTGKNLKQSFNLMFEKTSRRDAKQVLANGGAAVFWIFIYFIFPIEYIYWAYIVSIAAATADTWATELGVFNKSNPIMITTFKPVEKGESGAISLIGTLSALAGSIVIILSSLLFSDSIGFQTFILLVLFGFSGSLFDSLIGAKFQAQYINNLSNKTTEKPLDSKGRENQLLRGYIWINNDAVNFISIFMASLLPLIFLMF